ncbi:hypothetical protein [Siphonobacter sp. SORGH_AS_0500]|uniref:hypothetical protein n=1 Tax=Siphonobacter sp. SORGH_AS_0500 TaxID=1864824 RepID=UPI00286D14EA|nr:hypothetical protein [Siphonobacter sp. SORGH_AS_0500]
MNKEVGWIKNEEPVLGPNVSAGHLMRNEFLLGSELQYFIMGFDFPLRFEMRLFKRAKLGWDF